MAGKTEGNLKEAFAGESQANQKYLAFSTIADKEGYSQVAKLFRAAAAAESVHARNHLMVMAQIKETRNNIKAAIDGEMHEKQVMYPEFITAAEAEGNDDAAETFKFALAVETIHADLYQKALDNLGKNETVDYWVCGGCGNTVEKEPPDKCPICGAPRSMFKLIS